MKLVLLFAAANAIVIRNDKDTELYHKLQETLGTEEANAIINTNDFNEVS